MSHIKSFKSYCSFCRRDLTGIDYEPYNKDLLICLGCKDIILNDPFDESSPIVLFDDIPVLQADAKVLEYFEKELNLPLPAINLRNFFTEDEVYGYLIEDNQVIGLGLDGADIESLSAIILNLQNLKYLSLKDNLLTELPSFINSLTTLEILDVTKNKLPALPSLQNLQKLYHLGFRDNLIAELPILPPNLLTLNARWNRIRKLTNPLPSSLKKINLAQNRLIELPEQLAYVDQLEELNLYGNQLTTIPDVFTGLQKLKIVILRVNRIVQLPESIQSLLALEKLDVEENNLEAVPNLKNLHNLKDINVSKNKLTKITGLNECKNLVNIDIRDNKFKQLDITGLELLQLLDISYNEFTKLPKGLATKTFLQECIVSGNKITSIQAVELQKLQNLSRFSLAKNDLTTVPDLSMLSNLQELYLNDNKLEKKPDWITKVHLRSLTLDNNKFSEQEKKEEEKVKADNLTSWFE